MIILKYVEPTSKDIKISALEKELWLAKRKIRSLQKKLRQTKGSK
jgi:hypothetical protein